jgi:hypothetical protein
MILSITKKFSNILQVISLDMHWINMRSFIQPTKERQTMNIGCNWLQQGHELSTIGTSMLDAWHVDTKWLNVIIETLYDP